MTVTHTTAIRNGLADYVADQHDVGGGTSKLQIRDGVTVLIEFNLPNPAFGAAAAGIVTLLGVPIATTAAADGVADNFITLNRGGTQILAGSVTATGMGGDIVVSNTNIALGQNASLDSLTYEAAS